MCVCARACVRACVLWLGKCVLNHEQEVYALVFHCPTTHAHTPQHTHTQMLCYASMRACSICAPPHLLSHFSGRTPVLLGGGGVGGEAGGVEEDREVGAKTSVPHLSLRFLGSPDSVSPCARTIQATGRSLTSGPANKFAPLSSGGKQQHLLEVRVPQHTRVPANSNIYRLHRHEIPWPTTSTVQVSLHKPTLLPAKQQTHPIFVWFFFHQMSFINAWLVTRWLMVARSIAERLFTTLWECDLWPHPNYRRFRVGPANIWCLRAPLSDWRAAQKTPAARTASGVWELAQPLKGLNSGAPHPRPR